MLLRLAAAAAAIAGSVPAVAQEPRVGDFLYADPRMVESVFERSVVLLVEVNDEGALGLIINKPTQLPARSALPLDGARLLRKPLYLGGPVATQGVSALLRRLDPGLAPGARRVLGSLYFTTDVGLLQRALQEASPDRIMRVYAGYSGWSAGQLQGEIADGHWVVARGRVDAVFSEEPEEIWPEVHQLLGRVEARYRERPIR